MDDQATNVPPAGDDTADADTSGAMPADDTAEKVEEPVEGATTPTETQAVEKPATPAIDEPVEGAGADTGVGSGAVAAAGDDELDEEKEADDEGGEKAAE